MSSPAYVNNGKSRDFLLLLIMDKIGMGVLPQVSAVPHVTLISRKRNKPTHPVLLMYNIVIPQVNMHKHFGVFHFLRWVMGEPLGIHYR